MEIKLPTFNGIMPKKDKRELSDFSAELAHNVNLESGKIYPFKNGLANGEGNVTMFKHRHFGTEHWQYNPMVVDYVNSPVNADKYDRIYYTGKTDRLQMQGEEKGATSLWEHNVFIEKPFQMCTSENDYELMIGDGNNSIHFRTNTTYSYMYSNIGGISSSNGREMTITAEVDGICGCGLAMATPHPMVVINNGDIAGIGEIKNSLGKVVGKLTAGNISLQYFPPDCEYPNCPPSMNASRRNGFELEATVTASGLTGMDASSRFYVQTYVNDIDEEGPPSEISPIIKVYSFNTVVLKKLNKSIPITVPNARPIVKRRIYRASRAGYSSDFLLIGELDIETDEFIDDIDDDVMIVSLPAYGNPEKDLSNLVQMPNGFLAGNVKHTVYFSEPYMPYAWPYHHTTSNPIVGLGVSGNSLIALTTAEPEVISGDNPKAMQQMKFSHKQSCVSKRAIANIKGICYYASPDGIVSITGSNSTLITEMLISRDDWQSFNPPGMIFEAHDEKLYILNTDGISPNLICDFNEGLNTLTTFDINGTIQGVYADTIDDTLYYSINNIKYKWNQGIGVKAYNWHSKTFKFEKHINWSVIHVKSNDYSNIIVRFYAEGINVLELPIISEEKRRIPMLKPAQEWSFEIITSSEIYELTIGNSYGRS